MHHLQSAPSRQLAEATLLRSAVINLLSCRCVLAGMLICRASAPGAVVQAATRPAPASGAQATERPPPKRPVRCKRFPVPAFDPEDLALHVEYYELWPVQLDDERMHHASYADASDLQANSHLPSTYSPIVNVLGSADGHLPCAARSAHHSTSSTTKSPCSDKFSVLEISSIRERGGYLAQRDVGKELIKSRHALTSRQRLGLGPDHEDEFLAGPDYRYNVGENGRVADMVAWKRSHVPMAFEHALPAGWSQAEWLAQQLEEDQASEASAAQQAITDPDDSSSSSSSSREHPRGGARSRPGSSSTRSVADWAQAAASNAGPGEGDSGPDAYLDDGGYISQTGATAAATACSSTAVTPSGRRYLSNTQQDDTHDRSHASSENVPAQAAGQQPAPAGSVGSTPGGLVLRVFTYCLGPAQVFHALWDLDLTLAVKFVGSVGEADMVLHRKARPHEQQFAYPALRKAAAARRIPFVSVWDPGSAQELRKALWPVFQLYAGQVAPGQIARRTRGGSWKAARRLRI